MNFFTQIIVWINAGTNAMGGFLLAPIMLLPGWLSNTIISALTGVIMIIIFKYTSNQTAIGRVRDDVNAHLLALKLYKDSISVTLRVQGRIFRGAGLMLFHAVRPMLVMIVPVSLLLAQMGLWYQSRPLLPGEDAVITMKLSGNIESSWPKVSIQSIPGAEVSIGPVRVLSQRQIYWKIEAMENGNHPIVFQVDGNQIEKELAIGDGFMPVSLKRPSWRWTDILQHPREKPFRPDSIVQSVSISYPDRLSRTSGTHWWLIYFFIASMIFALLFKPFLKVRI